MSVGPSRAAGIIFPPANSSTWANPTAVASPDSGSSVSVIHAACQAMATGGCDDEDCYPAGIAVDKLLEDRRRCSASAE